MGQLAKLASRPDAAQRWRRAKALVIDEVSPTTMSPVHIAVSITAVVNAVTTVATVVVAVTLVTKSFGINTRGDICRRQILFPRLAMLDL